MPRAKPITTASAGKATTATARGRAGHAALAPSAPVLPELAQQYLNHLIIERKLAHHTVNNYGRELSVLARLAGDVPLARLEHHQIRRFVGQLHAQGLTGRSIARALSAWRTFYEWLARHDHITANPVADIRAPKSPKRLPKALSPDLAVDLVSHASAEGPLATRDAAVFELFYSSGLRLSELVGLDAAYTEEGAYRSAGWIDFDAGEVTVTGKGSKKRSVPVGQPAVAAIRAWLVLRGTFCPAHAKPGHESDRHALFLSERGTRLTGRAIQQRLKAHALRLGIPANVHPHVLRHSFASHVLQSSGDLRAVQEMLGHASIAATQVYTSLDFQRLAAVYDAAHPRARKR